MVDRLAIPAEDIIEWEFQVEQQTFITRYGVSGGLFYKQVILQSKAFPTLHPVKRMSATAYHFAERFYIRNK